MPQSRRAIASARFALLHAPAGAVLNTSTSDVTARTMQPPPCDQTTKRIGSLEEAVGEGHWCWFTSVRGRRQSQLVRGASADG